MGNRLGWCVVHLVERTETIEFLDYGHDSKESAVESAREYYRKNPGIPLEDIFVVEDVNEVEKRYSVLEEVYRAAGIPIESEYRSILWQTNS